ncbi:unnamed protein product [Dovyalis caffra]|uniref:Uncharacterized protein n=1 Tax=Dovyalis caffra TaxID=77055 RepID=A0AAV1R5S4_9ROSI|nr:unnamed protein product [Dovyalis caffra]
MERISEVGDRDDDDDDDEKQAPMVWSRRKWGASAHPVFRTMAHSGLDQAQRSTSWGAEQPDRSWKREGVPIVYLFAYVILNGGKPPFPVQHIEEAALGYFYEKSRNYTLYGHEYNRHQKSQFLTELEANNDKDVYSGSQDSVSYQDGRHRWNWNREKSVYM